ncbi:P-loop containing nucleoside triphosphate hydrolase protein [Mycena metata]|uniref:P-loop containing nucleoside triphosphate hydrolase protein n=1 Tax=Mycena metata TaxID=1033252 RepID=A0AAD7ILL4_9AGAR|nr:P-loop containing nucleoside triphosphate hydrolase protein [Mycena metata]
MEVDEQPTETYIGGSRVWRRLYLLWSRRTSLTLTIRPPKGCLMHSPPGIGNTLIASACAARPKHAILTWLACLWRKCSLETAPNLSAMPSPAIIFLDELDAIGTNQLGRFSSDERIKVIAATNHIDILDPALLRSGRLGRKIEFPQPNDMARARILEIHSRKMAVSEDITRLIPILLLASLSYN